MQNKNFSNQIILQISNYKINVVKRYKRQCKFWTKSLNFSNYYNFKISKKHALNIESINYQETMIFKFQTFLSFDWIISYQDRHWTRGLVRGFEFWSGLKISWVRVRFWFDATKFLEFGFDKSFNNFPILSPIIIKEG